MSRIALTPNASGTGTFTIAAPGTNTDRTLTLPDVTTTLVGTDATQTLTNKTLTIPSLLGTPIEQINTLSGTSVALNPDNGSIQLHTLTGATTYTDSFTAGEAMTLMIDDGTAFAVTWPSVTWVNNARAAPTLATTGFTVIALWKVSATLYGALVGNGS